MLGEAGDFADAGDHGRAEGSAVEGSKFKVQSLKMGRQEGQGTMGL